MTRKENLVTSSSAAAVAIASTHEALQLVDKFRSIYQDQSRSDKEAFKKLSDTTRSSLYVNLGYFYGIAIALLEPANEQYLIDLLAQHALRPARKGANPFGPVVQMMFGEWKFIDLDAKQKPTPGRARRIVDGRLYEYVPNRSSEKYAKAARFFKLKGWSPANVPQNLSLYSGKLSGVLKDEVALTRGDDIDEQELDQLVEEVRASDATYVLSFSDVGIKPAQVEGRKLVSFWGEIKDGEILLKGTLPASEAALTAYVRKLAKKDTAKLLRQRLARLGSEAVNKVKAAAADNSDEQVS